MDRTLLAGLRALAESSFPKRCGTCGRVYADVADYVTQTASISAGRSGLKQSRDDDGETIIELFRNCTCGSTLMDFFSDRRDLSNAGEQRRRRFDELLVYLAGRGLDRAVARADLLKVTHGLPSEILRVTRPPGKE
ncbi:MAG: oxidoreductase [Rhodocyclaceae bacterium]|nr:oxidoreductase [Rhodocyclaceae bacterium]